jgi:hypothetical protein
MADVTLQTWNRYRSGTPLPLGSALAPARAEGPPPFR